MTRIKTVPGTHRNYTYGEDDYGEYGSIFGADEDEEIPPPADLTGGGELERKFREAEGEEGREFDED